MCGFHRRCRLWRWRAINRRHQCRSNRRRKNPYRWFKGNRRVFSPHRRRPEYGRFEQRGWFLEQRWHQGFWRIWGNCRHEHHERRWGHGWSGRQCGFQQRRPDERGRHLGNRWSFGGHYGNGRNIRNQHRHRWAYGNRWINGRRDHNWRLPINWRQVRHRGQQRTSGLHDQFCRTR